MGAAHVTNSDQEILWADGGWVPNLKKPIYDKYDTGSDEMYTTWTSPYTTGWNSVGLQINGGMMRNYYSGWHYHMVCSAPKAGLFVGLVSRYPYK